MGGYGEEVVLVIMLITIMTMITIMIMIMMIMMMAIMMVVIMLMVMVIMMMTLEWVGTVRKSVGVIYRYRSSTLDRVPLLSGSLSTQ